MPVGDPGYEEKVAVITGGGRGIGRSIVVRLVGHGWRVVTAGLDDADLKQTKALCGDRHHHLTTITCDITEEEGVERLERGWADSADRLDLLVNCAAQTTPMPLFAPSVTEWHKELATNLVAAAVLSSWAIGLMKDRRQGSVVNIGSIYGSLAMDDSFYQGEFPPDHPSGAVRIPAYHASKGGIAALTRDLAMVAGPWNIRVNTVSPGMIKTPERHIPEERVARFAAATPLRRMGRPEDIASVVEFLASDDSSFVNGADWTVDGGWSIS